MNIENNTTHFDQDMWFRNGELLLINLIRKPLNGIEKNLEFVTYDIYCPSCDFYNFIIPSIKTQQEKPICFNTFILYFATKSIKCANSSCKGLTSLEFKFVLQRMGVNSTIDLQDAVKSFLINPEPEILDITDCYNIHSIL